MNNLTNSTSHTCQIPRVLSWYRQQLCVFDTLQRLQGL